MSTATMFCILLAVASIASARPTNFWNTWTRVQQSPQCLTQPASIVCQSALLDTKLPNGGRKYSYVHVCPGRGGVCINTQLPRCCESRSELEQSNLECVHATSLTVSQTNVKVKIFRNPQGKQCYHVDDPSIRLCCRKEEPFLECVPKPQPTSRPTPVCVPKRDIYFVVDSTDSVDDPMFCRFGYVLQLIVAAINPQGVNGARVAAILFQFDRHPAKYLFNLDDQCPSVVAENIQKVVYEYYGVKHLGLDPNTLTYPNVRATSTLPFSALNMVADSAESISSRPSSVITLTDGKSHQNVDYAINRLRKLSDPLIGAGIGKDVDEPFLLELASNSSTVVYEPNRDSAIDFAEKIVETMRNTAALCPVEAQKILSALNAVQEQDLTGYCERCMWTVREQWNDVTQSYCVARTPTCGGESLKMQAFDDVKPAKVMDWEKEMLEENILDAVEGVMQKEVYEHESSMYK